MRTGDRYRPQNLELITREAWMARPPHPDLGLWHVYQSDIWPTGLRAIAIHHAGNRSANRDIRHVQNLHMDPEGQNRNADIGYHFAIDLQGRIYEGRPIGVKGAHVARFNTGVVGVVLLADLDTQATDDDDEVTDPMRESATRLVADLRDQYPTIWALGGHREFPHNEDRSCPGDLGMELVAHLRDVASPATPLVAPTLENCTVDISWTAQ